VLGEGDEDDRVAAASEMEDEVMAASKPDDPEPPELATVEFEFGG
jgi:hypothetical protein